MRGARDCLPHCSLFGPENHSPTHNWKSVEQNATHVHSSVHVHRTSFMCFWTFTYPILVTEETEGESVWVREKKPTIPTGKASSHAGPSGGWVPSAFPASREQRLHSSAEDLLPASGAAWPTCQSQMTESLTVTLRRSLFRSHRDRTQSEILTLNLYMLPCDPFNRSFISLCSELAADSDENKLWPTFWELPLSSWSPRNQGVPQWSRIENWNAWPGSTQAHGDITHHIRAVVSSGRRLRKGLRTTGAQGLQHGWTLCFLY